MCELTPKASCITRIPGQDPLSVGRATYAFMRVPSFTESSTNSLLVWYDCMPSLLTHHNVKSSILRRRKQGADRLNGLRLFRKNAQANVDGTNGRANRRQMQREPTRA